MSPTPSSGAARQDLENPAIPRAPTLPFGTDHHRVANNLPLQEAQSVVVDPISQVPEAPRSPQRVPVEKTQVLDGRRLDHLRAEVKRHRRKHQSKKLGRLVLWGVTGAGAVLAGAFLAGFLLSPAEERSEAEETAQSAKPVIGAATEEPVEEEVLADPSAAADLSAESTAPVPVTADETSATSQGHTDASGVSLTDLPEEHLKADADPSGDVGINETGIEEAPRKRTAIDLADLPLE